MILTKLALIISEPHNVGDVQTLETPSRQTNTMSTDDEELFNQSEATVHTDVHENNTGNESGAVDKLSNVQNDSSGLCDVQNDSCNVQSDSSQLRNAQSDSNRSLNDSAYSSTSQEYSDRFISTNEESSCIEIMPSNELKPFRGGRRVSRGLSRSTSISIAVVEPEPKEEYTR